MLLMPPVCQVARLPYCKNLTLVDRHVVEMFSLGGQVRSRIDAGKLLEIVDEVRLVEVTAAQGNVDPVSLTSVMDDAQHLLKTTDAAEQFGGQPDFLAE